MLAAIQRHTNDSDHQPVKLASKNLEKTAGATLTL